MIMNVMTKINRAMEGLGSRKSFHGSKGSARKTVVGLLSALRTDACCILYLESSVVYTSRRNPGDDHR
jgi:hypothetical protein